MRHGDKTIRMKTAAISRLCIAAPGYENERGLASRLRSHGRYPPKVELPERKQQGNRLPTEARLPIQPVPGRIPGIYRSFAFLVRQLRRSRCVSFWAPEFALKKGVARSAAAEKAESAPKRSRSLLSTVCLSAFLVPKKGLEPSRCLRLPSRVGAEERTRTFTLLARCLRELVPKKGLEPSHPCEYMDLNHARLPIPPLRLTTTRRPPASARVNS